MDARNASALQQLADMVDAIHGMGPMVSKHLYEKGLTIPPGSAAARQRSQATVSQRSDDQSGRGAGGSSEYSMRMGGGSLSTKPGRGRYGGRSNDSSSSLSSIKTDTSVKTRKTIGSSAATSVSPAIVLIDFPGDCSVRSSASRGSIGKSSSRHY